MDWNPTAEFWFYLEMLGKRDDIDFITLTYKDNSQQRLSGIGATEDQIDMRDTVPQRIDRKGTKIEDEAGTGEHDSSGG